jgi:hypothetical protein
MCKTQYHLQAHHVVWIQTDHHHRNVRCLPWPQPEGAALSCGWCVVQGCKLDAKTNSLKLKRTCLLWPSACQEDFDVQGEISKGSFGTVYKIVRKGAQEDALLASCSLQ